MTHQEIKNAAARRPFRPFALNLSDGETVTVEKDHELAIHPHNKKIVIFFDPEGSVRLLDVAQVTELTLR